MVSESKGTVSIFAVKWLWKNTKSVTNLIEMEQVSEPTQNKHKERVLFSSLLPGPPYRQMVEPSVFSPHLSHHHLLLSLDKQHKNNNLAHTLIFNKQQKSTRWLFSEPISKKNNTR